MNKFPCGNVWYFLAPVIGAAAAAVAAADSPGPARWGVTAQSVCAVGTGRPRHATPRRGCQPQGLP